MIWIILLGISLLAALPAALQGAFFGAVLAFFGTLVGILLLAALFVLIACALVDQDREQETDSKFFRGLAKWYIQAVISLVGLQVRTRGMEQLPKDGRFLLLCNHIHNLDSAVLLHCFANSQLAFIAKRETRDYFLIGPILHKLQCQLINRENDREALKTILKCIQILKEDKASIAVFPEGYVSLDGKLRHFRSGVLKIAQKANVPILVCTVQGTKAIIPNLKKLKRSRVDLHLVGVIPAEQVKATNTVELAEQVYEMMIADMGEQFRTNEKALHPDLQQARMEQ